MQNLFDPATNLNPERTRLMQFAGMARNFIRGENVWLFNESRRGFLDAYAQYGVNALGYNHPSLIKAISDALASGVPAMVQPYTGLYAEKLAKELSEFTGSAYPHCVFTTSGAETVEAAIKLARMRSGRPLIVSAKGSYHGKTMGALAASDRQDFLRQHHASATGFARVEYGDIAALAIYMQDHGHNTAAFIIEPIQGERGIFMPPRCYLKQAKELCERYGVIFIADEIQTGLFRTGSAFACDFEEVTPDILLLAKALGGGLFPLGACLVNEKTWDAAFALSHSSTFANNNLACISGLTVLREMRAPEFQANLANTSAMLAEAIADLARRFPRSIQAIRGRGLMYGIELRTPDANAGYFLTYLHHQGLATYIFASIMAERNSVLVLPALNNTNVIRIAPPLVVGPEHIELIINGLQETLELWESGKVDIIARTLMEARITQTVILNEDEDVKAPRLHLPRFMPDKNAAPIDYAFIIHPTSPEDIMLNDPHLRRLLPAEFASYCGYTACLPAGVVCDIPEITSANGVRARGVLIGLPLLPEHMAERGKKEVADAIAQAVDMAHERGVKIVGLGAFTSTYSSKGATVCGRGPFITTGNLLTAGMTFEALKQILAEQGRVLEECNVGIVGAKGSAGALLAQLVARESPHSLTLIGNPRSSVAAIERSAAQLRGLGNASLTVSSDITTLNKCDVIISASSSSFPILDAVAIRSGTIICDVARPFDTSAVLRARSNITVVEAGLVALPDPAFHIGIGNLQGHPAGVALACLSETMLLALAGAGRDYGIGDNVSCDEVDAIMQLARKHGFTLANPGLEPQMASFMSNGSLQSAIAAEAAS